MPLISGKVSQFPLPKEGNYFDIKIINAVSPQNFIVSSININIEVFYNSLHLKN